MRKLKKIIPLRIAVALALLVILGAGTGVGIIKVMFTPEHLRVLLIDQLQQIFQRPVQIGEVSVLPFKGVKIKNLRILDAPDLPGNDFIVSDRLSANYSLSSLLRGKLVLSDIRFESPKIQLIKRKNGSWNFSDITQNYRSRKNRQASGRSVNLGVSEVHVADGSIMFYDLQKDVRYVFYGTDMWFSDFGTDREFPLNVSFDFKNDISGRSMEGALSLQCLVNLSGLAWENAYLKDIRISAAIGSKKFEARGGLSNFINPGITASFGLPPLLSSELIGFGHLPEGLSLPASDWQVSLSLPYPGKIKIDSADVRAGQFSCNARGEFDFSESTNSYKIWMQAGPFALAEVSRWWGRTAEMDFGGKGRIKLGLEKSNKGIGISRLFVFLDNAKFRYKGYSLANLNLSFAATDDFHSSSLSVSGASVGREGLKLSGLELAGKLYNETISLEKASGILNDSSFKLTAKAESILSKSRKLNFAVKFAKLDIEQVRNIVRAAGGKVWKTEKTEVQKVGNAVPRLQWLRDFKRSLPNEIPVISGMVEIGRLTHADFVLNNFKLSLSLKGIASGMKRLSGKVAFKTGPGVFYQIQNLSEKEKIYRIAFMPFLYMYRMDKVGTMKLGSRFKDLAFRDMGGEYNFESGRMRINNFYVDSSSISACSNGNVQWVDEKMNLNIYTMFNSGSDMGGLSESLTDSSGKPALAFVVEGLMEKPQFRMLSPKKNGKIIEDAVMKGVKMDFSELKKL